MARPVGRPSKYDPAYCDVAIEFGKIGKSIEYIACHIGVGTTTLQRWCAEFEDFRVALETAKEYEQVWWEEQAQCYMIEEPGAAKLNATLWSRSMAARFPKKYRDNSKLEITGENGSPLITAVTINLVKPIDNSKD